MACEAALTGVSEMEEKQCILIVDDVEMNREFLSLMLEDKYRLLEAEDGEQAIQMLEEHLGEIDLILLDVVMPKLDGFGVLNVMNERHWIDDIPVIMVSAESSPDYIAKGYDMGVTDYISRPYDGSIVKKRVENTIMLYAKQKLLQKIVKEELVSKQKNNRVMIDILSTVVEFRNGESGMHVVRVRTIVEILLEAYLEMHPEIVLPLEDQMLIRDASSLHDIGKIVIPEEILNKPGRLTAEEFEIMKTHSARGADMLKNLPLIEESKLLQYAHEICRWHHERWDGRGYPDGLKGDEIPLSAQLVSLADVYDALTSERVYKPAYSHDRAIEMIHNGECGQFNPDILECLRQEESRLEEKIQVHSNEAIIQGNIVRLSEELLKNRMEQGIHA